MSRRSLHPDPQELAAFQAVNETETEAPPAWEEIDTGRFMPRRIRGSYRGGVLG